MNTLLGWTRLFSLFFILALLPTLLFHFLGTAPVYNTETPSLLLPLIVAAGSALLLWILPLPSAIMLAALLLAGVAANTFFAAFSPVPDYIPLPWDAEHFLNAADLAILGTLLTLPWVLHGTWKLYWRA